MGLLRKAQQLELLLSLLKERETLNKSMLGVNFLEQGLESKETEFLNYKPEESELK